MSIKDLPHVTVEQVLALRKAAIKLEQENTAYRISLENLEAKEDHGAWVSVDDRLPKSHLEYLVYDGSDVYECLLIRNEWDTMGTVTHWQPKPLPPTQEG